MSRRKNLTLEDPNRIPFERIGGHLGRLVSTLDDRYPVETKTRPAHAARATMVEFVQAVTALVIKVTWREADEPASAGIDRQASFQILQAATAAMSVSAMLNPAERAQLASRILGIVHHVEPKVPALGGGEEE